MVRKGFRIFPNPGIAEEYEKRHNELWPEMEKMIYQYGGHNHSILLDRETSVLYEYPEMEDEELWAKSADTSINCRWWNYMTDIMETRVGSSPICVDFISMFHLN